MKDSVMLTCGVARSETA